MADRAAALRAFHWLALRAWSAEEAAPTAECKAVQAADDMAGELREVKALLKQLLGADS